MSRLEEHSQQLLGKLEDLASQLESRLAAVEERLLQKASSESVRALVAEALRPVEEWMEDVAQATNRRRRNPPAVGPVAQPAVQLAVEPASPLETQSQPKPATQRVAQVLSARAAAKSQRQSGSGTCEDPNEQQRSNAPMIVTVAFGQGTADNEQVVSVEIRPSERIAVLKEQALNQLEMWCRFLSIGGEVEQPAVLPPLEGCSLYVKEEADQGRLRTLSELDTVRMARVENGTHVLLLPHGLDLRLVASVQERQPPEKEDSQPPEHDLSWG
eukprot:CAMPEP_0171136274 /NCGR_PEP_ID=MMETSP0766_2-20121228/131186_1 /TAXON_ID=439317 /ORGANISM="Gambierdiscus australes, Strain CAWD 149" /LENGTH=271 /DNA_ID=CAMNT_0011599801 /DNA_START=18 /DNA_END=831 /DNA_ORIENTATION=+